jgi:hypothetical protein
MSRGLSARNFALDLKKFGRVIDEEAKVIFQKITLELDSRIVLGTPVETGRARGNWFPSVGAPSPAVNDKATDKSGAAAISAATTMVGSLTLGDVAWFTNNLPYILPLENGHSGQAPQGMVDINLNAVQALYGGTVSR